MSRIYTWGANSHGQLGLGFTSELCSLPVPLPTPPGLCADDVIEISGGGGHVLLLTRTGAVFACGWNNRGQLGSDGTASTECKTRLTAIDVQHFDAHMVCTVRAGWDCSAVITTTGDVFVWGSNVYGLLGGDRRDVRWSDVPRKLQLPDDKRCLDVQFGLRSAAFLTSDAIYIIASEKLHAQLSKSTSNPSTDYEIIPANDDGGITFGKLNVTASLMACGTNHLVYADDNALRAIGDNRHAQCQRHSFLEDVTGKVKQLRSGWTHCGALCTDGTIQLWGRNVYGQLGRRPADDSDATTNILRLTNCDGGDRTDNDIVVDLRLGAEHGLARKANGEVWTWGWNEHGNCGNGSEENSFDPVRVELPGKCWLCGVGAGFCVAIVRA